MSWYVKKKKSLLRFVLFKKRAIFTHYRRIYVLAAVSDYCFSRRSMTRLYQIVPPPPHHVFGAFMIFLVPSGRLQCHLNLPPPPQLGNQGHLCFGSCEVVYKEYQGIFENQTKTSSNCFAGPRQLDSPRGHVFGNIYDFPGPTWAAAMS